MFAKHIYAERRQKLRKKLGGGLILFLGNSESPVNYPANQYAFRQDSAFLYFFGLAGPELAVLMDVETDNDCLYGTDLTLEDVVWMGVQPSLGEMAGTTGIAETGTPAQLEAKIKNAAARGRKIHFLPPYRGESVLRLGELLGVPPRSLRQAASEELIRAVVELRSAKSDAEIAEIESALEVTGEAFAAAARAARPGADENDVAGKIDAVFASRGRRHAYPVILSTHGEILHNLRHGGRLKENDLLLLDCGSESPEGYASDVTRTYPVGGKFAPAQKDVYEIVLRTQLEAIAAIRPGAAYREIHLRAAATIASGLKDMGLMRGSVEDAVAGGAHALFFPHGLGHMLGLDVHDMEGLGEDYVGYDGTGVRSSQFGLGYLRLAKALRAGNVLTVEPGIYFIPALIDQWKAAGKFAEFIDYARVEKFRSAGGTRVEDDVLVTDVGSRVLGTPIPKSVREIEALTAL